MIATIITYSIVALLGAVIGIFIYRNNRKLVDPYAKIGDQYWDKLELTAKIKELQDKLEALEKD